MNAYDYDRWTPTCAEDQARHTLTIGAAHLRAEGALPAAAVLTVTTYSADGPTTRELSISSKDAAEALAYTRRRADESGGRWASCYCRCCG